MSTAVIGAPGFRARSGRLVQVRENGTVTFDHANGYLSPETAMDAEEFFQAQRDIELGRWRWPENPDYVVYAPRDFTHYVRVVDERGAFLEVIHREHVEGRGSLMAQAARAFFEAHPEEKPWQMADEGDVWALKFGDERESSWFVNGGYFQSTRTLTNIALSNADITAARRVFPAEDAS